MKIVLFGDSITVLVGIVIQTNTRVRWDVDTHFL